MARPKQRGPKTSVPIPKTKKIPANIEPSIGERGPLSWKFGNIDKEGPFAWANLSDGEGLAGVIGKLKEFESKNWDQLLSGGSHPIPINQLARKAQNRLQELKLDEYDELMSLRLSGKNRVWAYWLAGQENILRLLWWDPDHQVYPVKKDKADRRKSRRR